jgi:hypothetical protein
VSGSLETELTAALVHTGRWRHDVLTDVWRFVFRFQGVNVVACAVSRGLDDVFPWSARRLAVDLAFARLGWRLPLARVQGALLREPLP